MKFVYDYLNDINARTLALRKIQFRKRIKVKNDTEVSYLDLKTIDYDPLVKALYNQNEYSDSELKQLDFLTSPIFISMN